MNKNKLVVLFPGKRYSCELPLLYFANLVYRDAGYDVLPLTYPSLTFEGSPDESVYRAVIGSVRAQLNEAGILQYKEVVFISKSMGTVVAGIVAKELNLLVRHIYLTPLEETFPYMKDKKKVVAVVQGTGDKWLDPDKLKAFCEEHDLNFISMPGVGHRLEMKGDMDTTLQNFRTVVKLYEKDVKKHK